MDDGQLDHGAMARVLVTGATGFVGRAFVHQLGRRGVVTVGTSTGTGDHLTPTGVRHIRWHAQVDTSVQDLVGALNGIDVVVHLAAMSRPGACLTDPRSAFAVNVVGTAHLLEAVRSFGDVRQIVVASTRPLHDSDPRLHEPYFAAKRCVEEIAHCYASSFGLPVTLARFSTVYGPGDHDSRLIPSMLAALRRGSRPMPGRPEALVDLVHVDDAVGALLRILAVGTADGLAEYDVATGHLHRIADVARLLAAIHEGAAPTGCPPSSADDVAWPPDWRPRTPLVQGLSALVGGGGS